MPGNDSWRDLQVWQKAHTACLSVYRLTTAFPAEERYGLGSQLRRASSSVPANIAEGKGRATNADFRHFLIIARGSLEETRYHLLLAGDLGYLTPAAYESAEAAYTEVSRMLNALIRSLS
jgi:four helix bundle protein